MGAALSQVSGTEDVVCSLETQSREQVIQQVKESAKQGAIKAGADPAAVEVRAFGNTIAEIPSLISKVILFPHASGNVMFSQASSSCLQGVRESRGRGFGYSEGGVLYLLPTPDLE